MTRAVIVAFAAAAILPVAASAQYGTVDGPVWGERVRLTPWAGISPRVSRSESWTTELDGEIYTYDVKTDLDAGPAAGAEVEVLFYDRFSIIGGGALIARGETFEVHPYTGERIVRQGADYIVAKLGLAMRLREEVTDLQLRQLTATLFAAPAFIREQPKDDATYTSLDPMNMLGANVGITAQIPLGLGGLAIQLGVEDFLVFWDDAEIAQRLDAVFLDQGELAESRVSSDISHMLMLRAGLSFRFR
jgi:hypothetical protein